MSSDDTPDFFDEIKLIERRGNLAVAHLSGRKFPGVFVQADTLFSLLEDIAEEAPGSFALRTVEGWLADFEDVANRKGFELPYFRA